MSVRHHAGVTHALRARLVVCLPCICVASVAQQALPINRAAFRVAHSEWKKLRVDTRMYVAQLNDLECPACVPGQRALHGDGNQKLFTWARGKEASREAYYKDMLFAPADTVYNDMKAVGTLLKNEVRTAALGHMRVCARLSAAAGLHLLRGFDSFKAQGGLEPSQQQPCSVTGASRTLLIFPGRRLTHSPSVFLSSVGCPLQRADTHCGGHWSAATNQAQRREKQEITGRYFLTDARHGGPVAALNQVRTGERYSYALTLALAAAAHQTGLAQLHIDIMCKWAGWLRRVSSKAQQLQASNPAATDPNVRDLSDRLEHLRMSGKDLCSCRLVHSAAHGSLHAPSCQVWLRCGLMASACVTPYVHALSCQGIATSRLSDGRCIPPNGTAWGAIVSACMHVLRGSLTINFYPDVLLQQVLYQPSAVDGCGKVSGEAGEQLFASLSPLGHTTCHQSVAGVFAGGRQAALGASSAIAC